MEQWNCGMMAFLKVIIEYYLYRSVSVGPFSQNFSTPKPNLPIFHHSNISPGSKPPNWHIRLVKKRPLAGTGCSELRQAFIQRFIEFFLLADQEIQLVNTIDYAIFWYIVPGDSPQCWQQIDDVNNFVGDTFLGNFSGPANHKGRS